MNLIDTHFKKIAVYIRRSVDQIRKIERLQEQIRLELDVIEYQLVQIKREDYVRSLFEQVSGRGVVPETNEPILEVVQKVRDITT